MRTGRSYFDQGNRLKVHRIFCCDLGRIFFKRNLSLFFHNRIKDHQKRLTGSCFTHLTTVHNKNEGKCGKWQSHPSFWCPSLVSRSSADGLVGCLKKKKNACSQAASQRPRNQRVSVTSPKSHKKPTHSTWHPMSFLLTLWRERLVNVLVHHSSDAFPVNQSIFQVCCLSTSQSQPGLCLWGSTWDHLLQKNRKIQPPKPAQNGDMCGSWKTSRPWVKSFRSSEMRLNLTLAFLWSQWSKLPNVVLLLLSLEKMKYSSIRLNKILKRIVHKIVLEALCLDFTSYPMEVYLLQCHNHLQPLHVGSILQGLALTAWKMAKWQSVLHFWKSAEPKNRRTEPLPMPAPRLLCLESDVEMQMAELTPQGILL